MARKPNSAMDGRLLQRVSKSLDDVVGVFSPAAALSRARHRFAYEVLDNSQVRKKRSGLAGTGDKHLTANNLGRLREITRDLSRNNPLAKGLLKTERDGVIGSGVKIQARTNDKKFNEKAEKLWTEYMVQQACDVTGRFNFNKLLSTSYLSYRRDGDMLILFTDAGIQAIEGDRIGTPGKGIAAKQFTVTNGVATSNATGRVIGYYIGKPNNWGRIDAGSYKKFKAVDASHIFNPDRFSQSRGEPALTASIDWIDKLCGYMDAELVAAKVNACFTMFIKTDDENIPDAYTDGVSSSGETADGSQVEKMEPGSIIYGGPGESAMGIGMTRPGNMFDPFVQRMLTFIGRPLCMPLMLITLDFAGATFMNARIAYQKVQEAWQGEQDFVVKPLVWRSYRWFIDKMIKESKLKDRSDKYACQVQCHRWPYVDPYKEGMADKIQLINGTTTRHKIIARQGDEYDEIHADLAAEKKQRDADGLNEIPEKPGVKNDTANKK